MRIVAALIAVLLCSTAGADEPVRIAVASNFQVTAKQLVQLFHEKTGQTATLSAGSTGMLYAQITQGAPFDVFLAADDERPALLERNGYGVGGSRFTYAIGSLVVFSSKEEDCLGALNSSSSERVAIANPATSPYGEATRQYLESVGLWDEVSDRAVFGQNISQTWSFAFSRRAAVAFVSWPLVKVWPTKPTCIYEVPSDSYDPIEQQAILIDAENEAAQQFLEFLQTREIREVIRQDGYEVPE